MTDSQTREIQFRLPCSEITRIRVSGAERCDMGELTRFTDAKGQCLARVQLGESDIVRFTR